MYGSFAHWESLLRRYKEADFHGEDICTEIIFMKYKEEIQVITPVNEFLIFHTNLFNQHDANSMKLEAS